MGTLIYKTNAPNKVDPTRTNAVAVSNLLRAYENKKLANQNGSPDILSKFAKNFSGMPAFAGSSVDQSGKLRWSPWPDLRQEENCRLDQ